MIALAIAALSGASLSKLYFASFDDVIEEYEPFSASAAKAAAKPTAVPSPSFGESLLETFRARADPTRTPPLGSVRLAFLWRGRWLIADKFGRARLDGRGGDIDVVALERLFRRSRIRRKEMTTLLRIVVINGTRSALEARLGDGRVFATAGPGRTESVGWLTTLRFRQGHNLVAEFEPLRRVTAFGRTDVRFSGRPGREDSILTVVKR